MKKTGKLVKRVLLVAVALFVLMIVIAIATSGGDTETEEPKTTALPVKFGEVTSVGPLGEHSEMIVISLPDDITIVGPEQAVYVSAVDYIFTYASDELTTLSVFGYDVNGEKITAFTMPTELISSLRQIEADGNWGTEGFAAWFGINDEAYGILVASSIPAE